MAGGRHVKLAAAVVVALAVTSPAAGPASGAMRAVAAGAPAGAHAAGAPVSLDPAAGGAMVLTATEPDAANDAPTFTGNGELGIRVPATGQGWAPGPVPATAQLAGFYAQPAGAIQQRATIPTWSTLTFSDGDVPFSMSAGRVTEWRQTLDLRTGVVTTAAQWTAPDGHTTGLTYQLLTDRADGDLGLVRLTITPAWSGTATVTDAIDDTPATLVTVAGQGTEPGAGEDWQEVRAEGTGLEAGLASDLVTGDGAPSPPVEPVTPSGTEPGTTGGVGQAVTLHLTAGHPAVVTKYVAVVPSSGGQPQQAAMVAAARAAGEGFGRLVAANDRAWARLWAGRIDVLGDPSLATDVNASEFYLWASTRAGSPWSLTPGGLSSAGYNGHVFWDADTWMFPALLAQHPDLAATVVAYRDARLAPAEQHAAATGYQGARYPWESALNGTEQVPPPDTVFTEGLYEQHITADVALAQWQYYLATGNRQWLATQGWPVLSAAATFWASRATAAAGVFHIDGVTGPDEENQDVDDEAYTVAAARGTLRDAMAAARVLGRHPPSEWSAVAAHLVAPTVMASGAVAEFAGYGGQMVKQADVTMLQYPWGASLAPSVEQADLNYYVPRTDPQGPSMSDAVDAIDTAALGTPGCSAGVFTERSVDPFIRDVFDQFSETSTGGTFTFMTGIGGFLQEFLYGYSGLRWSGSGVALDPLLSVPLGGLVLHDLQWHGTTFTVAVGPRATTVTVTAGGSLPLLTTHGARTVALGHPLTLPTRRPDLAPSPDLARCQAAVATSSLAGAPALAAVDGSPATGWQPTSLPATLTVPLRGASSPASLPTLSSVTIAWGEAYPRPTGLDVSPLPGPVTTLRADRYTLSADIGGRWRVVATVSGRTGVTDVVTFPPVRASAVALHLLSAPGTTLPVVDELSAGR